MPPRTPPPGRPRPVLFWIIAAIIIAAIIVAWIYWANDLGRGINPNTNVPLTPGYAPATSAGGPPASVPAGSATRPAPANAATRAVPNAISPPRSGSTAPASGGTH
ncbi:MAG TPA: hypothetical protein VF022_05505 [Rhodanobacteraceae bacterium]